MDENVVAIGFPKEQQVEIQREVVNRWVGILLTEGGVQA